MAPSADSTVERATWMLFSHGTSLLRQLTDMSRAHPLYHCMRYDHAMRRSRTRAYTSSTRRTARGPLERSRMGPMVDDDWLMLRPDEGPIEPNPKPTVDPPPAPDTDPVLEDSA